MVSPRIVPAVAVGSFAGAGLTALPFETGLILFGLPLFTWSYWRLILWKTQPSTREVTAAVWLGALTPLIAFGVSMTLRQPHDVFAGIVWAMIAS